jgi:hypothetical protein
MKAELSLEGEAKRVLFFKLRSWNPKLLQKNPHLL